MPSGTVIRSFAAPGAGSRSMAWDGRTLWIADNLANLVYQVDPVTGTTIRSFVGTPGSVSGVAHNGLRLYLSDFGNDLIYERDLATGTTLRSFATPAAFTLGIYVDSTTLWGCSAVGTIYQVDLVTGTTIRSFASPDAQPRDFAGDGRHLWLCGSIADRIYLLNRDTGTVITSFSAPFTDARGIAWDGRTLWYSDGGSNFIYQLSVTPGASYADRVLATGPIGYWPQWEAAGTISFDISGHSPLSERDGAYTGVTLGQPGIGDGRTGALYDGANDYDDIFTASIVAAFNGREGTVLLWGRVFNVGVWTDGTARLLLTMLADNNNRIRLQRAGANNTLQWIYNAGGVQELVALAGLVTTDWFSMGMTWSLAADEMRAFYNGPQTGAIQNGLGAFVGNLIANRVVIGAGSTVPANVFNGYEAHVAVWDRPLSPAEVLSLGVL